MSFNLDSLDPLTEIINSGQAFTIAVALEKIIWAFIGIFFLGAISTSITKVMRSKKLLSRKSLYSYSKYKKNKEDSSNQYSADDD